jgi:hypothetical protein
VTRAIVRGGSHAAGEASPGGFERPGETRPEPPLPPQDVTSNASTTIQAQQPDGFQVPVTLIMMV